MIFIAHLASQIAKEFHFGQTRKDRVTPYINHLASVVDILYGKFLSHLNNNFSDFDKVRKPIIKLPEVGEFYNCNPMEVYFAAAWLHDILEDTKCDEKYLWNRFFAEFQTDVNYKLPCAEKTLLMANWDRTINVVKLLTKTPSVDYVTYLKRIKDNIIAKEVKLADLQHNMSDLDKTSSLFEKYTLTKWFLEFDNNYNPIMMNMSCLSGIYSK